MNVEHLVWQYGHMNIYVVNDLDELIAVESVYIVIEPIRIFIPVLLHDASGYNEEKRITVN